MPVLSVKEISDILKAIEDKYRTIFVNATDQHDKAVGQTGVTVVKHVRQNMVRAMKKKYDS